MNPLDRDDGLGRRADRTWWALSDEGKREFETRFGRYERLSDAERMSYLGSYLSERKHKGNEELIKTLADSQADVMKGFASSIGDRLDQLNEKVETVRSSCEDLRSSNEADRKQRSLEYQQPKEYVNAEMVGTPTGIAPQTTVYMSAPLKMDCRYREKGGPEECIMVENRPEGTYGICTVGDQVRRMQVLPRWFTTAFEKAGCPSNKVIRPCEFYLDKEVPLHQVNSK